MIECQLSVNRGIDGHSSADVFSTHDPNIVTLVPCLVDLITTFVSFIVEKPSWLLNEQNLLANLIHVSIEGASALYTVKGSKLFKFFEKIFKEIIEK